jgi:hypothetical protein
VVVETTTDLSSWSEAQRVAGQGGSTSVRVTITPQPGVEARFWRVRGALMIYRVKLTIDSSVKQQCA